MKPAEEYEKYGRELWHRGEYEHALKMMQEGLSFYPKNLSLRLGVAMAQLRLGNFVVARDALKNLAHTMPGSGDVLAALAEASLSLGKKREALASIRLALHKHRHSASFLEYLAVILNQHGLFKESATLYKRIIRLAPDRADAYFGLGVACSRLRNTKEAVKNIEKAVHLKKDFYEALSYLGNIYYDTGKRAKAIKIFLDIKANEHMDPTTLTRLLKYCRKRKELNHKVAALEARLQALLSGSDISKFVQSLESKTEQPLAAQSEERSADFTKTAGLKFIKVWKEALSVVPEASELFELDRHLQLLFQKPSRKPAFDKFPVIQKPDTGAVEGFIESLAVYFKEIAEKGALPKWGPISHWGKMWGINDLSPYACSIFRKIYESPDEFFIKQVSVDALMADIVNILKWMPPGLRGSEWIVELGGTIIAFWTKKDMLERLFLMREILTDMEKKCIEPLIKRGRSWRRWLGYKADRARSYPSSELFAKIPKTLGAGQPVKCTKCRRIINDYWDIADFNDAAPVRCGDCAKFKRCPKCQGPLRQVSLHSKGREKLPIYRCMECYGKHCAK